MSCSDEEEIAVSQTSDNELADDKSNTSGSADSEGLALQPIYPAGDNKPVIQPTERPFWNSSSPRCRRITLDDGTERDSRQAWSGEPMGTGSGEYLDLGTLGPPQCSSSPVKRTDGQRHRSRGCAGAGGGEVSGAQPQMAAAPCCLDCTVTSVVWAPRAGHLRSAATTYSGQEEEQDCHQALSRVSGMEEDMRRKRRSRSSIADKNKMTEEEVVSVSSSTDAQTPPEEVELSGFEELSETTSTSDSNVRGTTSFDTKCNPQTLSRKGWQLQVEEFESDTRKMNPEAPQSVLVNKRVNSTAETMQARVRLDPLQGSRAVTDPQHVHFRVELGPQYTSERVKAGDLGRNRVQIAQHRSGDTSALPLADVTAQLHNVQLSPSQSCHRVPFPLTSEYNPATAYKNEATASQSLFHQQLYSKLSSVQQGDPARPTKTKLQHQRMTQQQQSVQGTRDSLHEFMPRQEKTGWNSCANRHQETGISSPVTGLKWDSNRAVSDSMTCRILSQQRYSSPMLLTEERSQQFCDSDTRTLIPVSYSEYQEPVVQRTVSGANGPPGILLSDEIPTRDGETELQPPRGSGDGTSVALSGFLVDNAQRAQTLSANQNFQLEMTSLSGVRQSNFCALPGYGGRNSGTAEAGTQTILSVSTSPGSSRTVSTAPPVCNSQQTQQYYRCESTPASTVNTIPNDLRALNLVQSTAHWPPRGVCPVPQRFPAPIHTQRAVWQPTYHVPVSFQVSPRYVPLYPRYPDVPRLLNAPWIQYPAAISVPYTVVAPPPVRFPTPPLYYAPPVQPMWIRPTFVCYAPPAQRFWQSLPRTDPDTSQREPHQSRQAVNERVAAWLQQMEAAGEGRAASPAALSSDSGVQAAASSGSQQSASSGAAGTSPSH
ncbi:uncharacterized protein LOC126278446 isoform X2 [Schistocerca gregaria]|uniref:uncharacterized protein LOC126278446 isoform X2 n=1 Tax=Schistocerca gregaria TaxID=7010 RepID=UPI00211DFBF5|nr:uncharacterized protein LOC126278446 isoform X2 [Schistocerca gregaria]